MMDILVGSKVYRPRRALLAERLVECRVEGFCVVLLGRLGGFKFVGRTSIVGVNAVDEGVGEQFWDLDSDPRTNCRNRASARRSCTSVDIEISLYWVSSDRD